MSARTTLRALGVPAATGPLRRSSLPDMVAETIRERIRRGELRPGDPLKIDELASELEISRTPIREALGTLESMGLIERKAGRVPTVFQPSRANAREYYEMRIALEPIAGRLATPNVTDEVLDDLRSLLDEMERYEPTAWFSLNCRFHETLYAKADRPYMSNVIRGLIDRSDPYIRLYFSENDLAATQRGHRSIVDAAARRDADAVAEAIRTHLDDVVCGIVGILHDDD